MATTATQVFDIAMALVDEVLDNGTISDANTRSYKAKTPSILTLGQFELMKIGDLYKPHEISNKPIKSMYGLISGFDMKEYEGTELTLEALGSAKAYYFEVDGPCTVYVEDYNGTWNTIATITVPDTVESFTGYKGIVTPTSGAINSRLRFTGDYYYRIINYALFDIPLNPNRIPDYRPWVKKEMPSDFKSLDQIISEHPQRQYQKDNDYKWEGRKDLYINYYYEGNLRIVYRPVPSRVTDITDTLEIDDITATTILPYFLASHLMLDENPDIASFFNDRFIELKAMAMLPKPVSAEQITDVYGVVNNG